MDHLAQTLRLYREQRGRQHYKGLISMDLLILALASLAIAVVVSVMK